MGEEEAESSTLYLAHGAEDSPTRTYTAGWQRLSYQSWIICHTLPKYMELSTETKSSYRFLRKSRHVVVLHSFITHKIMLLC